MFSNISGLEIFYDKSIFCDDYIYDKINILLNYDFNDIINTTY